MIKKIIIFTAGRSDYGMLKKLASQLEKNKKNKIYILASGAHFSKKHGFTIKDIIKDKFKDIKKIDLKVKSDLKKSTALAISTGIVKFYDSIERINPNFVIVLGDRYETFSFSIAANIYSVPIIHLHGGEITSGAIDDTFRHCITKMSDLHFVANKIYKKRVVQLGENPKKVYDVGGLSVDKIKINDLFEKSKIEKKLKFKFLKKNLIITIHPETIDVSKNDINLSIFLNTLKSLNDTLLIFTFPNADFGNAKIIKSINLFSKNRNNVKIFYSLGHIMYLSILKQVDGVIGNSSSALSEAPFLKKGSINIGTRQDGRIKPNSVIDCKFDKKEILKSIKKLYSKNFKKIIKKTKSPYGNGGAAEKISNVLNKKNFEYIKYKKFFDIR